MTINFQAAWIGMALGALAGAAMGLFFQEEGWFGGYPSWRRRMIRLGHISFFGLAFVNLGFALTAHALKMSANLAVPSALLVVGAATMPLVCYLSAYRKAFRHFFFVPAGAVICGVSIMAWRVVTQ